jgi:hypothetical protein
VTSPALETTGGAGSAEHARLTYDSDSCGNTDTVTRGVRSASSWRQLSFRSSGLTIELSVVATGLTRRLMGQLLPRQPAQVDIRHGDTQITVQADDLGRFMADDVPPGPVSIRCRLSSPEQHEGSIPVVTGWVSI